MMRRTGNMGIIQYIIVLKNPRKNLILTGKFVFTDVDRVMQINQLFEFGPDRYKHLCFLLAKKTVCICYQYIADLFFL